MPAKKNFYAVVKGRKPGIYTTWFGADGAEEQVKGYPGAVYQGFATRSAAESYLRAGGQAIPASHLFTPAGPANRQPPAPAAPSRAADHQPDLAAGKTIVFTDGASTGNPGPGGYGVVILSGADRRELSGGFRCTTNNRMELLGVITALRALGSESGAAPVVLYSDSRYVVDAVTKGWARRWRSRDWMRDDINRAENADLWAQLLDLLDHRPVEFRWVRGHANNPENERCDRLAVQAAHQKNLPPDTGFTGRC